MRIPNRPSPNELQQMSASDKDALILLLFDLLEGLQKRLDEVEQKVEKTSRNSSKPPSSDGLKRQPATPRSPGSRPSGGQMGHEGATLPWTEVPDIIEVLKPEGTCTCGQSLTGQRGIIGECRQQIDIPEPKAQVTEYRQVSVRCTCGCEHHGQFPAGVGPYISYGPRIKAYAVGLIEGHFVALDRAAAILADQYGVRPSDGTLQNWIERLAAQLEPAYEETRQTLMRADTVNFDESGLRVAGHTQWLHVACTAAWAFYSVHAKRGREAMDAAGILPVFQGTAVHDHWKPYFSFGAATHSLCNAHILRELRYFEETTAGHQWPIRLRELIVEGKLAVANALANGQSEVDAQVREALLARYDEWVTLGLWVFPETAPESTRKGRPKQHPATNLLRRLRDFRAEIWRFLDDFRVPFDNNLAERRVRPAKVKLKVAGGFRAVGGAEAFCIIRSIWESSISQGHNPFQTLRAAFAMSAA